MCWFLCHLYLCVFVIYILYIYILCMCISLSFIFRYVYFCVISFICLFLCLLFGCVVCAYIFLFLGVDGTIRPFVKGCNSGRRFFIPGIYLWSTELQNVQKKSSDVWQGWCVTRAGRRFQVSFHVTVMSHLVRESESALKYTCSVSVRSRPHWSISRLQSKSKRRQIIDLSVKSLHVNVTVCHIFVCVSFRYSRVLLPAV